jgi:hypothetical protein
MITNTEYKLDIDLIKQALNELPSDLTLNEPMGNFFYDPWNIKSIFVGTIWEQLLNSLHVSDMGQARILILEPGEVYQAHSDIDDRWHLTILGEQSYLVDLDTQTMHKLKQDGLWYYMNTGYIHTACNFGPIPRIQLVVRRLLKHGTIKNPINIKIDPLKIDSNAKFNSDTSYRYKFDNIFSPWLNHANKENILDNFKYDNLKVTFTTELEQLKHLHSINQGFSISADINAS